MVQPRVRALVLLRMLVAPEIMFIWNHQVVVMQKQQFYSARVLIYLVRFPPS